MRRSAGELRQLGFTRIEDLGPDEAHERYRKDQSEGCRLPRIVRLVKAGR